MVQRISEAISIGVKTRNITLEFRISGDVPRVPLEGIHWYLQRDTTSEIIGDSRHVFSYDRRSLTLIDLELNDEGNYTMNATNIIGTGFDMIYLDVESELSLCHNQNISQSFNHFLVCISQFLSLSLIIILFSLL